MSTLTEPRRTGAYLVSEAPGTRSREAIVINATAGNLPVGTLLAKLTDANAGTASAVAGNTGNGTISGISVGNEAITGTYRVEITAAAANGGSFEVSDPNGTVIGTGTVGTAFSASGLAFTLGDGSTDFIVGDAFTVAVNAGLGEYVPYDDDGANDGRRTAAGILYAAVDATSQDAPAVAHVRDCEVDANELEGLDDSAVADLLALGIIVRGL